MKGRVITASLAVSVSIEQGSRFRGILRFEMKKGIG
jgi:hypothetical protein